MHGVHRHQSPRLVRERHDLRDVGDCPDSVGRASPPRARRAPRRQLPRHGVALRAGTTLRPRESIPTAPGSWKFCTHGSTLPKCSNSVTRIEDPAASPLPGDGVREAEGQTRHVLSEDNPIRRPPDKTLELPPSTGDDLLGLVAGGGDLSPVCHAGDHVGTHRVDAAINHLRATRGRRRLPDRGSRRSSPRGRGLAA